MLNYFGLLGKLQEINDDLDNLADAVAAAVPLEKQQSFCVTFGLETRLKGSK